MRNILFGYFVALLILLVQQLYAVHPPTTSSHLSFTGGGIYFWWQAGAAKAIQEISDVNSFKYIGASAGSLTAVLLATNASFDYAAEFAVEQAYKTGLFGDSPRRNGLAGIWGPMVQEWLDVLITNPNIESLNTKLHIAVTPLDIGREGLKSVFLSDFIDKKSLITACLASTHIPFFMDGKFCKQYNGRRYIDGSFYPFLSSLLKKYKAEKEILPPGIEFTQVYVVDWRKDLEFVKVNSATSFVQLITPDGLNKMMNYGYNFMKQEINSGKI